MRTIGFILLLPALCMLNSNGQLTECYQQVNHLIGIVEDLRTVKKSWQQLGFDQIRDIGEVTILSKFSGENEAVQARMAIGYLDKATVVWIQSSKRGSPFSEYMKASKEGIYSLVYSINDKKALKDEAQRLKDEGILIFDNLEIKTGDGKINYYLFNTSKRGKFTLGFMLADDTEKIFEPENDGSNVHNLTFAQYAFAISSDNAASDYWNDAGWPEFTLTHDSIHDKAYYGNPAGFDMKLGWQRHGSIPFEWIIPLEGPNVYEDHLKIHGEGVHHLAFETEDMDKVVAAFVAKGFVVSQSGGWGTKGEPGSGRFVYLDPKGLGGITVELLWNYK